MKKLIKFVSFLSIAFVLFLFGCNSITIKAPENVAEKVAADFAALKEEFKKEEITIKNDLPLSTKGESGTKITWVSSDESVIKSDGTLPEITNGGLTSTGDLPSATLTATVSYDGFEGTESFSFNVVVNRATADAQTVRVAKAAILNQYEGVALSGYILEGLNIETNESSYSFTFATREDVTVEYISSARLSFTGNKAMVTRPTEAECISGKDYVVENLHVKMSLNDVTIETEIPLQITKASPILTVGDLRDIMNESSYIQKQDTYVFRGTVSLVWETATETNTSYQGFMVQDDKAAILIYSAPINDSCALVTKGDEVVITATTCFYNGLAETSSVSAVQILATAENNQANIDKLQQSIIEVTTSNFTDAKMKGQDSKLAKVKGLIFDHMTDSNGNSITEIAKTSAVVYFFLPGIKTQVAVSLDKYSTDYEEIKAEFNGLKLGDIVDINECAISWYTQGVQLRIANKGKIVVDTEAKLSKNDIFKLDQKHSNDLALALVYSTGEYDLVTSLPFGSAVTWAVKDTNEFLTINEEGKLVITSFVDPFDFTLVATIASGQDGVGGKDVEFTAKAVNPVSLNDVMEAVDGSTFKENTATKGFVADVLMGGTVAVLANGNSMVYVYLPLDGTTKRGDELTVLLSSAQKQNNVYKLTASSIITSIASEYVLEAASVKVNELTSEFKKVEIDKVTVASGKASVSDQVTVEFVDNQEGNVKFADGTYYNLKGYTMPKDDSTILFVVQGVVGAEYKFTITAKDFLGYNGTDNVLYGNRIVDFNNITFNTTELGCYGAGIQTRSIAKSSNTPQYGSAIWNLEAINGCISKIEFEYESTKTAYDAGSVFIVSFGDTKDVADYKATLGQKSGVYFYEITPNKDTYKYFKIAHDDAYTYSAYWGTITIYITNAPTE